MVSPSLQKHFRERGVGLIPLDAGAEATVACCSRALPCRRPSCLPSARRWAATERAVAADVVVDATRTPQLDDHRVQGTPVVPVAMAIEWIARGSLAPSSEERAPWCCESFTSIGA